MNRIVERVLGAIGCFLVWGSRFGVNGDTPSRSFRAACWTTTYLVLFLFTLINVAAFYGFGQGFMFLVDAHAASCGMQGGAPCSNPWIAIFAIFVIPPFALSLYVRRLYARALGARAAGREYFLYALMGLGFFVGIVANLWIVSAAISLLLQCLFWGYCSYLGVPACPKGLVRAPGDGGPGHKRRKNH